jgi:hypothetical protein
LFARLVNMILKIKRLLVVLGLSGALLGIFGCTSEEASDEDFDHSYGVMKDPVYLSPVRFSRDDAPAGWNPPPLELTRYVFTKALVPELANEGASSVEPPSFRYITSGTVPVEKWLPYVLRKGSSSHAKGTRNPSQLWCFKTNVQWLGDARPSVLERCVYMVYDFAGDRVGFDWKAPTKLRELEELMSRHEYIEEMEHDPRRWYDRTLN